MNDEIKKFLFDILSCINGIAIHITNIDNYEQYKKSYTSKRAVERELEIIGEAVKNVARLQPSTTIENFKQIIALRNRIAHAYDSVDDADIWNIVKNHIPKLKTEIENLLK
ncbi:MAG: hypothetical protein RIQ33_768 [Bacteroidota bacterium]|jgi:uncharacterized protein with HEPN domain